MPVALLLNLLSGGRSVDTLWNLALWTSKFLYGIRWTEPSKKSTGAVGIVTGLGVVKSTGACTCLASFLLYNSAWGW